MVINYVLNTMADNRTSANDRFVVEESVKIEPELMTIRIRKVDHESFLNMKLGMFQAEEHNVEPCRKET